MSIKALSIVDYMYDAWCKYNPRKKLRVGPENSDDGNNVLGVNATQRK